jgi:hypothetical protein
MLGYTIDLIPQFYRSYWRSYLRLSFVAHLWLLGGALLWGLAIFLAFKFPRIEYWFGLTLVTTIGSLYCGGKFRVNALTISRLVISELRDLPETASSAIREINHRLWGLITIDFFLTLLSVGSFFLLLLITTIALYFIWMLFPPVGTDIFAGLSFLSTTGVKVLTIVSTLMGLLLTWLWVRWGLWKLHFILDRRHSIFYALRYSARISRHKFWSIIAHDFLVGFLSTFPSTVLVGCGSLLLWDENLFGSPDTLSENLFTSIDWYQVGVKIMIMIFLIILSDIIGLPMRQIAKAGLYFRLSNLSHSP